jgi:uncharacterized membrane protein (DUF2068 family)
MRDSLAGAMMAGGGWTMRRWLEWFAVAGNAIFILWLLYNGIDEGFRGTAPQIVSALSLSVLLVVNSALIVSKRGR